MKLRSFSPLLVFFAVAATLAQDKPDLSKVPGKVMDGLKTRFPHAEVQKLSEEKEGDFMVYDFEFLVDGQKFEADIKEDGSIHNWEKEITAKDLSDPVRKSLELRYPKASVKEVMQVTEVKDGKEELEGYEIVLQTTDNKEEEITISPDGRVLEDTGTEKK